MVVVSSEQTQPVLAARAIELEGQVSALQEKLDSAQKTIEELRQAYRRALEKLRLMEHRLFVAKAERADVAVEQLAFDGMLEEVKNLERTLGEEPSAELPDGENANVKRPRKKPEGAGRRNLEEADLPIVMVEVSDPLLEGKAERIGKEESWQLGWERGGLRRILLARVVYKVADSDSEPSPQSAEPSSCTECTIVDSSPETQSPHQPGDGPHASVPPQVASSASLTECAATPQTEPGPVGIVKAPMPRQLVRRGMLAPSLIAHILVSKYLLGVPFYRTEQLFELQGASLDRATMCRYAEDIGATLGAIVEAARKEAFETAFCLSTDATGVCIQPGPLKERNQKRGPCRKGHFFVILADRDHVFFEYQPKHTSAAVSEMFRGFSGYIQADAHAVYDAIFRGAGTKNLPLFPDQPPPPKEVACWSHARRKFWEAATCKYALGLEGLRLINEIFVADGLLAKFPQKKRHLARQLTVKRRVDAFYAWVREQSASPRERGLVSSALGYVTNHEAALRRFLEDGRLRLDNNLSENALRSIAAGRKAWLFFGSDDHASAAANLFSLIAGCKLHRIDPEAYLGDVIRVMPYWPRERYLELAPKYWAKTRSRLRQDELAKPVGHITVPPPAPE